MKRYELIALNGEYDYMVIANYNECPLGLINDIASFLAKGRILFDFSKQGHLFVEATVNQILDGTSIKPVIKIPLDAMLISKEYMSTPNH